ncbi:MAG: hypothetical protein COB02_05520 [Candidatus Cloacimonadota bacterium]|nr:MAG: hypothetical protein COB02_05520 [Candidatus Cloacimonadota bacterium]
MNTVSFFHKNNRGSSLFVVFGIISVLFILGVSFLYMTRQQIAVIRKTESRLRARYLAESGVEKAIHKLKQEFLNELVYSEKDKNNELSFEINNSLYDLIEITRAENYQRVMTFREDELEENGKVTVLIEAIEVSSNEFSTFIDYQEKIPANLKVHQKPRNAKDISSLEPLGGISARLRFTSCGEWGSVKNCIELVKTLQVTDITPPAPDHTLFIHSTKKEKIQRGKFELSNLTLPPVIVKLIFRLSQQIKETLGFEIGEDKNKTLNILDSLNKAFSDTFNSKGTKDSIEIISQLSSKTSDDDISETVDNIILSLNPRNWGRIRTNGRLDIDMPFFAADDIINYFAEAGSWRDLPEVGYLFHDNRLHDPYMSVYTHYEGLIYKKYRKIYPSQYGITEPEDVPPEQYTINTRLEYPKRYKQKYDIQNLKRYEEFGMQIANEKYLKKETLIGTKEVPFQLNGIWHFKEGVEIGGYFTGRGTIISDKAIEVNSSLIKANEHSSLSLVSLWNEVILTEQDLLIQAAVYARKGLKKRGCDKVFILGNLVVEELKRSQMPSDFSCRFDYNIKNHMVDNIFGNVPDKFLYYRSLKKINHLDLLDGMSTVPKL